MVSASGLEAFLALRERCFALYQVAPDEPKRGPKPDPLPRPELRTGRRGSIAAQVKSHTVITDKGFDADRRILEPLRRAGKRVGNYSKQSQIATSMR